MLDVPRRELVVSHAKNNSGGALSRPFYPDGLNPNPAGPFSREITEWSVFNDGLQLDLGLLLVQRAVTPWSRA